MIFNLLLCLIIIFLYALINLGKQSKETKNKVFLVITFVILFFVVATREMNVGNDTKSYINLFNLCNMYKFDILNMNFYYEKGYLIFNVILNYLNFSPRFFMYIMSFIFNVSAYCFIKDNSKNYLMSVLMYINLLFFYQSMTMMRQFLALAIILMFSFKYVKNKQFLKFLLSIAVASLFHASAIIAVFIYPIYNLKYNRKRVLMIIVSSIIVLLSLKFIYPFIANLINRESYYIDMLGEAKLGNFISMLIFVIMYIFSLIIVKQKERQDYGFYLYTLLFTAAIYFVSINMAVLSRASQYYAIFSVISLPNLIEHNVKNNKIIVNIAIVFFMILYSSIVMIYRPEWNSAFNYKSCILPKEDYVCK